jgi:heparinase II/III-like protein/alginate lyase
MITATTLLLLPLLSSPDLQQGDSKIHVLEQNGQWLEILVDSQETEITTLKIVDGTDVEQTRVPAMTEQRHRFFLTEKGAPLRTRLVTLSLLDSTGTELTTTTNWAINPLVLPDHPSLTLTEAEIVDLKKRWPREPRTKRVLDKMQTRNDRRLTHDLLVPKTGGAWTQLYRCPDTHVFLEMVNFTKHRSPATGIVYTGSPYDECITTFRHKALGVQALEMALNYALTDDARYGERAVEILTRYALYYPDYQLHDRGNGTGPGSGKAFSQTLEEAQWLIDLARAYDLLRGSGLIDTYEQKHIEDGLFGPATELVANNNMGINNIQNWHNTALFLVSLQSGNVQMAREAAFGSEGMVEQLQQGVRDDGLWNEGSLGYHFFAAKAMLPMIQAIERSPINLDYSRVQDMFTAAFELIQPDFTLPMLNDGSQEDYEIGLRDEYEQILPMFANNPRLDDPMAIFGRGNNLSSVLYGRNDLVSEDWTDVKSTIFESSGLGVLRAGPYWQRSMAIMDYGPHGGWHGHYDKLGITAWMQGSKAVRECGADGYGTDIAEIYFRSTLGHSTVTVDGLNQAETEGQLGYFDLNGDATTVTASADGAYPGVAQRRLVHMTEEGHLLDMFEMQSNTSHTYDYVLHGMGSISTSLELNSGTLGFGGAYSYLSNVQSAVTNNDFEVSFTLEGVTKTVRVLGEPGTQVFLASSPGYPMGTTHPVLVVRRDATRTVFAAAITEGETLVTGFDFELIDDGFDPILSVTRPNDAGDRQLSFTPGSGI